MQWRTPLSLIAIAAMSMANVFAATAMVSAGSDRSIVLRSDGTVLTTGMVFYPNFEGPFTSPVLVQGLPVIASVAAGSGATFALGTDGSLWAWGSQFNGGLGNGVENADSVLAPTRIPNLPAMVQISCKAHCLALDASGGVWSWGANLFEQVGNGNTTNQLVPRQVAGLPRIVSVVAGEFHSLALDAAGQVWGWGNNDTQQVIDTLVQPVPAPVRRSDLSGLVAIAAGVNHSLGLKPDGTVVAWGSNGYGQLGAPVTNGSSTAVAVPTLSGVAAVCAASDHSMALKRDGTVWAWGLNTDGVIGTGDTSQSLYLAPVQVPGLSNITSIACGSAFGFAVDSSGGVHGWGNNKHGQLGDNSITFRARPVSMVGPGGVGTFNILASQQAFNRLPKAFGSVTPQRGTAPLVVTLDASQSNDPDGTIAAYQWYVSGVAVSSARVATQLFTQPGTYDIDLLVTDNQGATSFFFFSVQVDAAPTVNHTTARIDAACGGVGGLRSDGRVLTWGFANPLGRPVNQWQDSVPGLVPGLFSVVDFAFGFEHGLAVTSDGHLAAWGPNRAGEVGDGTTTWRFTPVVLNGIASAQSVAAGTIHSLLLKSDGTVMSWGANTYGQLGIGSTSGRLAPVPVPGLASVKAVAAAGDASFAVKQDGTVWAWGRNDSGQLGDGTRVNRVSPVQLTSLSGIAKLFCKGDCFAITASGDVWGWGSDPQVLFDRPPTAVDVPFAMPKLKGFAWLMSSFGTGLGLDANGALWAWGRNDQGQFGDGTRTAQAGPVRVPGVDHATQVALAACDGSAVALRSDGTVLGWGNNGLGVAGDGTLAQRLTPVAAVSDTLDGILDLSPDIPNTLPPAKAPAIFTQTTSKGALTDPVLSVDTLAKFNAPDVGKQQNVYVFAFAPAAKVSGAAGFLQPGDLAKDAPVACVLAQLNASGQLQAVSASSIQAYVSGVASSQGQAVSVLNGVASANIAGSTFFVGYGTSGNAMLSGGTNRGVASIAGAAQCVPQPPQTGWWWNPAEGGRGYSIEVHGNNVFFAAFLYDASGRSTWYVATGPTSLDGSVFSGRLLTFGGGQTLSGAYKAPLAGPDAGAITLAFNDAQHGTMIWPGGTVALERFAFTPNGLSLAPVANQPESGWWWGPAESGRGYFLEWQGNTLDVAGYMYDDAGNPVWYLSIFPANDIRQFSGSWWQFANGQTLTGAYRPAAQTNANVAPVTLQFTAPDKATITLPGGRTTSLSRFSF